MNTRIEPRFVEPSEESQHAPIPHPFDKVETKKSKTQRLSKLRRGDKVTAETAVYDNPEAATAIAPEASITPLPAHEETPVLSDEITAAESSSSDAPQPESTDAPCGCGSKKQARKSKKSLVVKAGETKTLARSASFASVINHGRLELASGAVLTTEELTNNGKVVSPDSDLEIHAERLTSDSGSFASPTKIALHSASDLVVRGGDFHAPSIAFDCKKTLDVSAHSINGPVSVKAAVVSVGVKSGDLNVAEHICTGDPVYWNEGTGSMTLADIASNGEDVVIWSNGNDIYIKDIDTTGGSGPGNVTIITNADATKPGDDSPYDCSDCSAYIPSGGGGGTVHGLNYFNVVAKGNIEIRANIQTPEDSVRLIAGGKIRVDGDIKTSEPGKRNGAVEIRAYKDASSSTEFVIGGTGNANGVNGDIDASTTGAGYDGNTWILVKNYAAGGIKVEDPAAVKVSASTGKTGTIVLDATDGQIRFSSGTLSADGASGQHAGRIYLLGDSIAAIAGLTTVTASDAGGFYNQFAHFVRLSATTISSGENGLTVKSNGGPGGGVGAYSKGGWAFSTIWNPPNPHTLVTSAGPGSAVPNLTFEGSGLLRLEGNTLNKGRAGVGIAAQQDVTFAGGPVVLESNGKWKEDHTGSVTLNVAFGHLKFADGSITVNSNGYDGSDGAEVRVTCKTFEITPDSTVAMHADGDGKGNGGYIFFWAGEEGTEPITFGTSDGTVRMSADGGTSDGNGGRIEIYSGNPFLTSPTAGSDIVIKDSTDEEDPVLSASPKGSDGDAGMIAIYCAGDITCNESNNEIHADGKGNGRGGIIIMEARTDGSTLDLGDNIVSAKGGITGDGGRIELRSNTDLTMQSAKLIVSPGQDDKSNGKGGFIKGKSEAGDINVVGNINADGKGKGKGGRIELDAADELNYGTYDFSAKGGSKGDGGYISLKSGAALTIAGSKTLVDVGQDAESNGEGGRIIIESGDDLTITGTMNANGKGNGEGGRIILKSAEELVVQNTEMHADGGCRGHGGKVIRSSMTMNDQNAIATATAGDGSCSGFSGLSVLEDPYPGKYRGGDYIVEINGVGPASLVLRANIDVTGKGSGGKGGIVGIKTPGAFSFGDFTITADGTSGGGGSIVIETGESLTVNSSKVSAKAGPGGEGGTIAVTVKKSGNGGRLTLNGKFDVSGSGKKGGNLGFIADTEVVLASAEMSFKANGGANNGEGGHIFIKSSKKFPIDITRLKTEGLSATGGGEKGLGGVVQIPYATAPTDYDPLEYIRVNGGSKLNELDLDGGINLNGVLVEQYRLSNETWPRSYWTSQSVSKSSQKSHQRVLDEQAFEIHQNLRNRLSVRNVELFTFGDGTEVQRFFHRKKAYKDDLGLTFVSPGPHLYVTVNDPKVSPIVAEFLLREGASHELGHAVDFTLGFTSDSGHYQSLVLSDFLTLDFYDVPTRTSRLACGVGNPFENVRKSLGGIELCPRSYGDTPNRRILRSHSIRHHKDQNGWSELYAQSFAYHLYVKHTSNYIRSSADSVVNGILANGYFGCVGNFALGLMSGTPYPRPAGCPRQIPAWYLSLLWKDGVFKASNTL